MTAPTFIDDSNDTQHELSAWAIPGHRFSAYRWNGRPARYVFSARTFLRASYGSINGECGDHRGSIPGYSRCTLSYAEPNENLAFCCVKSIVVPSCLPPLMKSRFRFSNTAALAFPSRRRSTAPVGRYRYSVGSASVYADASPTRLFWYRTIRD